MFKLRMTPGLPEAGEVGRWWLAGMSGSSPVPFKDLPVLPLCLEGPVSLNRLQNEGRKGGRGINIQEG